MPHTAAYAAVMSVSEGCGLIFYQEVATNFSSAAKGGYGSFLPLHCQSVTFEAFVFARIFMALYY